MESRRAEGSSPEDQLAADAGKRLSAGDGAMIPGAELPQGEDGSSSYRPWEAHLKSYGTVCWTTQEDSPAGPTAPEWWPPWCLCSHKEVA
ncbi:unnamed protein product [Arctogadus glacialis]